MKTEDHSSSKIRRAELADVELVHQISAEAYTPAYLPVIGALPKPAWEDYRARIERSEVWLLERLGTPCGVLVVETRPDHLLVYSIAVPPDQQRNGYGKALLGFAEGLARAAGLQAVRLYTNERMERNVSLYLRCGFVEIGRRPHPSRQGETLLDMEKTLSS
jgi:ribosomal protein S18 acetylase RimI-like enzyme